MKLPNLLKAGTAASTVANVTRRFTSSIDLLVSTPLISAAPDSPAKQSLGSVVVRIRVLRAGARIMLLPSSDTKVRTRKRPNLLLAWPCWYSSQQARADQNLLVEEGALILNWLVGTGRCSLALVAELIYWSSCQANVFVAADWNGGDKKRQAVSCSFSVP